MANEIIRSEAIAEEELTEYRVKIAPDTFSFRENGRSHRMQRGRDFCGDSDCVQSRNQERRRVVRSDFRGAVRVVGILNFAQSRIQREESHDVDDLV